MSCRDGDGMCFSFYVLFVFGYVVLIYTFLVVEVFIPIYLFIAMGHH
jgi:hypothetical protein